MTKSGQQFAQSVAACPRHHCVVLLNELDIVWILKNLKTMNLKKSGQDILIYCFTLAQTSCLQPL